MRLSHIPLIIALVTPFFGWAVSPGTVLTGTNNIDEDGATIDGSSVGNTGYYLESGTLNISNVTLQNFTTTGGSGSGGGAGLGGAVFVKAGTLNLDNVIFNANVAVGGDGGSGAYGGTLNGFLSSSTPTDGEAGDNAPSLAAIENGGNGRNGYNGTRGSDGVSGRGGAGGDGGTGSGGSVITTEAIKTAAEIAATLIKTACDAGETAELSALAATFTAGSASVAAASTANFMAAGVGAATTAVFAAVGAEFTALAATQGAGTISYDTAMAILQGVYLVAIETTSYLSAGVAGCGGPGGNGGNGGNGSYGFGGGAGGTGGHGGDAISGSIASGGVGGAGGNGGNGGFGGGGGLGGTPGEGGANGEHGTVVNGSLTGALGAPGLPGFGGGVGSTSNGSDDGLYGGGGAGFGGALFISNGATLNINGPAEFNNNATRGGSSLNSGVAGEMAGTDLFVMKGATINLNPGSGNTVTFNGTIADDSVASIGSGYYASGAGASINIQSGIVAFNNTNTYTGTTYIQGGVLQAVDGVGIHPDSNVKLGGGVLESNGTFNRFLGTGFDRVQFTGSDPTGFSASGGDLSVTLNNGAALTWGSTGSFVASSQKLLFGSSSATDHVTFTNPINLNGGTRTILNTASDDEDIDNKAILSGVISNGSLVLGDGSHTGTIVLSANNTYTGTTQVSGGTLVLEGTLQSSTITIDSGCTLEVSDGGLLSSATVTSNGTFLLDGNETITTLAGSGSVDLQSSNLTLNGGTFSGVIAGTAGGQLTKSSGSTLTLSGTSTYTGTTQINAGQLTLTGGLASETVNIASGATLLDSNGGLSGSATVTNAGTLTLGANDTVASLVNSSTINGSAYTLTAATYTLNGGSTVNANLGAGELTSHGAVTLNGTSAASTFEIATGTMTLGLGERILDTADVTLNGTLILGGDERIGTLSGSGGLSIQQGTITLDGGEFSGIIYGSNSSHGLTKISSDTLTLTGSSTYTGTTQVSIGELVLSGTIASRTINIASGATLEDQHAGLASDAAVTNAGTLIMGASDTISTLNNSGLISGTGNTLTASSYTLTNGSVIDANLGTGTATSSGSVALNGTISTSNINVLSGTMTLGSAERIIDTCAVIADGMLVLGGDEAITSLTGAGRVSVEEGTLTLNSGNFSGVISGTKGLHKVTGGSLTLSGVNTFTGTTSIDAGSVSLTGSLESLNVQVASGASLIDSNGGLASGAAFTNNGTTTLGANDTVSSFTNSGTLNNASYTLTAGTYALNNGSVINANLGTGTLTSNGAVQLNGTSAATSVGIQSGTMTLGSAERLSDSAAVTVNGALVLGGSEKIGTLAGTGGVSIQQGALTVDSGTFAGRISGTNSSYGLTKVTSDTLTLSGTQTYTGPTLVNAGTLSLSGALTGTSVTIASGATLTDSQGGLPDNTYATVNGTLLLHTTDEAIDTLMGSGQLALGGPRMTINQGTFSGTVTGTGGVTKASSGTLNLSGINTYTGSTLINAGTLNLSGSLVSPTVTVASGATLNDNNSGLASSTILTANGTVNLNADETIDTLGGSGSVTLGSNTLTVSQGTFSGAISGTGGNVTKTTSGTLTLSGTNTYTGTTQVNAGTLALTGSLASATVDVASGATLTTSGGLSSGAAVTNAGTWTLGANDTIASLVNTGTINGSDYTLTASTYALNNGSVVHANLGEGELTITGTAQLYGTSDTDTINVTSGATLRLMGEQLLPSTSTVNLYGTMTLEGGDQTISVLNGTGNIFATIYNFIVTGGGNFTGVIDAPSTQMTTQGGDLSVSDTTVSTDHIQVSSGGSLNLTNSSTTSNTVTVSSNSNLQLANSSSLTNTGNTVVQTNANLSVTGGSSFNADGSLTMNSSSSVDLDADSELAADEIITGDDSTLTVADSSKLTYSTLKGTGTVDSGENAFTNVATVSGFVNFTGDFVNQGTLSPGNSPGLVTIGGNYTESSLLNLQIAGTSGPGTNYDQVQVAGTVTVTSGATLNVEAWDGFEPILGTVYQVISGTSGGPRAISGTFSHLTYQKDQESSPVVNAAALLDVSTGQLLTTGLNYTGSLYADLGANDNQRRAATSIFNVAQIAENQIDTTTFAGARAKQIINAQMAPCDYLARYVPDYYGSIADASLIGDRALVRQVFNRVSPFHDISTRARAGKAVFMGYLDNNKQTADLAKLTRSDYFVGGNLSDGEGFSLGAVLSGIGGNIRANLGRSDLTGTAGTLYVRQSWFDHFSSLVALVYSSQNHDIRRTTASGYATGSTISQAWTGSLGFQYEGWKWQNWSVAPRASMAWSHVNVAGFREEGVIDALSNSGYKAKLFTGEACLSAKYSTKVYKRDFALELLAGVEQEFSREKSKLNIDAISNTNITYDVEFAKSEPTRGTFGLNMGYNVWKMATLDVGYAATTGNRWDHSVKVDLRIRL